MSCWMARHHPEWLDVDREGSSFITLVERGAMPPVITAAAVAGPERSAALFDAAYREHARREAYALAGADVRPRE